MKLTTLVRNYNLHIRRSLILITLGFGFISMSAQWQFVGSPESCEPVNLDSEGDTMLVLTTSGLFFSLDTGSTWIPIRLPDTVFVFEGIQIERGSLYLSTKRYVETRPILDVFRSDDWGATWVLLNCQIDPPDWISQLVIKADTFYCISQEQIYISYDKGDHFTSAVPVAGEYCTYDIHHHRLYATVSLDKQNLLLRSSDDGLTWDTLARTTEHIYITDISSIEGVLWKIELYNGSHYCRVQKSLDDGDTWITTGYVEDLLEGFFDRWTDQIIGLSGQLYVVTEPYTNVIYHSSDGGKNWKEKSRVPGEMDVSFSQDRLFFISYKGLFSSQNHGEIIKRLTSGLEAATVKSINVAHSSIWVSSNSSLYTLSSENAEWQPVEGFREVKATRNGHLLAINHQNAYVSADKGENWTEITYEDLGVFLPYPMHYIMCAGDIMYITSASSELFYSTDYGETWHLSEEDIAYLLNYNGKYLLKAHGKLLTSEDGIEWTLLPQPEHPDLNSSPQLVYYMDPFYFTGSYDLLLRLHKDSTRWEEVTEPFSDVRSYPISILSHHDVLFLTVFGEGVFGSKDHGQTWYTINEGLTNFKTITLTKDYDFLYLGTEGGVWKRPLSDLTVGISEPPVEINPDKTCLITNNSVPLNLPYGFTADFNVRLFSSNGRLLQENSLEGQAESIELGDFPSGMYFIYINSSDFQSVKRIFKF